MVGDAAGVARPGLNMLVSQDTIAAVATPPGRGGVGMLRIAGPDAFAVAGAITGISRWPVLRPRVAVFSDSAGRVMDRGLVIAFRAPHSFTGDDVVELHAHGSPIVLDMLLEAVIAAGARLAQPGEFTLRAYLAGKMDLTQAEAVADLIDSGTRAMARAAVGSLQGEMSRAVLKLKLEIVQTRVFVEAAIDFPEDDIDPLAQLDVPGRVTDHIARIDALLARATSSLRLRDGLRVVLAGRPNAGKSSLLNRLSGRDSAIVTPLPGTTRDIVREHLDLDGVAIEMLDTAGLREPNDVVEAEGIRRARAAIEQADLLLLIIDATATSERGVEQLLAEHEFDFARWGSCALVIINKVDVTGEPPGVISSAAVGTQCALIRLSAQSGAGIDGLRQRLRAHVQDAAAETSFLARRRHVDALQRTRAALVSALALAVATGPLELLAEELRLVQSELGGIVGDVSSDELLGSIFATFCIGK